MTDKRRPQADDVGFYVENFTRAELADLDRALNESLQGEIGMLRVVMRRFFERTAEEADDMKTLADALRVLSLSCSRLAKMIQAERGLQDQRVDELGEALSRSLGAVLDELSTAGLSTSSRGG
ncbi:MAG: hypothetical protein U9R53_01180 [Chloroflexota bacterium]|nr:hypothetical protein [Chloroflexota bacterium]